MKNEKTMWVFFFHKHSKFLSISLEDLVDQKPFISQECSFLVSEAYIGVRHLLE